jgi:hypothetical protein
MLKETLMFLGLTFLFCGAAASLYSYGGRRLRREFANDPPNESALDQLGKFRLGKKQTFIRLADPLNHWGSRSMILGGCFLCLVILLHFV